MQPTDLGLVGFRVSEERHGDRKEDERDARKRCQGFLRTSPMKARVLRLFVTLSSIAATAIAGGAAIKGF